MRQSEDQQRQFRETLDSFSVKEITDDQKALHMQRRKTILPLEWFQDAIGLFPTNKQCEKHKYEILRKSKYSVSKILAEHNKQITISIDANKSKICMLESGKIYK